MERQLEDLLSILRSTPHTAMKLPFPSHDSLTHILYGFSALQSPKTMQFPSGLSFTETQDFLLNYILLNPHFKLYPPSRQYQSLFWKWAIENLETYATDCADEDPEIDERIFSYHISLMCRASSTNVDFQPPTPSYVTYLWSAENLQSAAAYPETTTLLESRTIIESGTTGLRTWLASLVLAQYLALHSELVDRRHVLELGSGAGFLGIIIATLQQRSVPDRTHSQSSLWLTDVNDEVLRRCNDNIRLPCNASSKHSNLRCCRLDWSDATDTTARQSLKTFLQRVDPDIIVGADIVFDPSIVVPLVEVLRLALEDPTSRSGKVALIALTVRNENTVAGFLSAAKKVLTVEVVDMDASTQLIFAGMTDLDTPTNNEQVKLFRIHSNHNQR